MTTKWLRFDNHSDERDFAEFIQQGKAVIVLVKWRHLPKKYKYKMFLPIISYAENLYSTDIYEKSESCKSCRHVWVYSTPYTVEKIVRPVELKDISVKISDYYHRMEVENPKIQEAIKQFIVPNLSTDLEIWQPSK